MDDFARRDAADRRAYIEESANRRDLTPTIIEKDFWVCWTLRRLTRFPELAGHITFKGGTSLSKAHGIIARFSEDIDLTIRRTAPLIEKIPSPMEEAISGNERQRRTKALGTAAAEYVVTIAMPRLAAAIEDALGTGEGWSLELDPDDKAAQTLLFHYPRISGYGFSYGADYGGGAGGGYIKPRIKLEYGARGDPEPHEERSITPYLAEDFPGELPGAVTAVETLSIARTFWEKATILHALHHSGKIRDGLSRHYYDLVMLERAGVGTGALEVPELLGQVVRNKSLMFADAAASYGTAVPGTLRLVPADKDKVALSADYSAMADMFMVAPPPFDELMAELATLEAKLNADMAEAAVEA
ncbi:MAG TPA: nucleotidyl transferase AbiEii/AbiGii toxin family protein [Acetobacteraceae bacterium]|nr:nucleotidyl transferase AbiEii/AbiGii toxin family protein [Acetobacteraceae bacterium]